MSCYVHFKKDGINTSWEVIMTFQVQGHMSMVKVKDA